MNEEIKINEKLNLMELAKRKFPKRINEICIEMAKTMNKILKRKYSEYRFSLVRTIVVRGREPKVIRLNINTYENFYGYPFEFTSILDLEDKILEQHTSFKVPLISIILGYEITENVLNLGYTPNYNLDERFFLELLKIDHVFEKYGELYEKGNKEEAFKFIKMLDDIIDEVMELTPVIGILLKEVFVKTLEIILNESSRLLESKEMKISIGISHYTNLDADFIKPYYFNSFSFSIKLSTNRFNNLPNCLGDFIDDSGTKSNLSLLFTCISKGYFEKQEIYTLWRISENH